MLTVELLLLSADISRL